MEDKIDAIYDVADQIGGRVRESYSGRGMYGKTCYGIVCEDTTECIEAAAERGIRGAETDSMGRSFIVYWRNITGKEFSSKDE